MIMTSALTSSIADCWETPRALFEALDEEFSFRLDAAASAENTKCPHYYDIEADGLASDWGDGPVWLNPPYGRQIAPWMDKCADYAERGGGTVCALIPMRSDTAWFHRSVMRASELRLFRGRIRFGGSSAGAPFPSALAVFRPGHRGPPILGAITTSGEAIR